MAAARTSLRSQPARHRLYGAQRSAPTSRRHPPREVVLAVAANLHEQLRHVLGPAPQPWTEAAIEVGALRVELVARADADVMIEGPPQRQAREVSLVRGMHDSARMTAHRDADGDNWLFGTAGAAGGSSCGWLAVGLLALFVAGCGENSPLCEAGVVG